MALSFSPSVTDEHSITRDILRAYLKIKSVMDEKRSEIKDLQKQLTPFKSKILELMRTNDVSEIQVDGFVFKKATGGAKLQIQQLKEHIANRLKQTNRKDIHEHRVEDIVNELFKTSTKRGDDVLKVSKYNKRKSTRNSTRNTSNKRSQRTKEQQGTPDEDVHSQNGSESDE